MIEEKKEFCHGCKAIRNFSFTNYCGAFLCDVCDYHLRLARCYCGWSASGGNGYNELREMGEQIEEDY